MKIDKGPAGGLQRAAKRAIRALATQVAVQGKAASAARQAGQSLLPADRFGAPEQPVTDDLGAALAHAGPQLLAAPLPRAAAPAAGHNRKKAAKQAPRRA